MQKLLGWVVMLILVLTGVSAVQAYNEAPMLRTKVAAGELPPVDERLPLEPKVLTAERNAHPDGVLEKLEIGKYGGTIRLINLAPNFGPEMYFMTIEPLLDRPGTDLTDPIKGNVLKDYEFDKDRKTYTFHMRKGLKWSDGVPVTTEDVRFWYEDILLNKELTPYIGDWYRAGGEITGEVLKLEIVDDYTFRIKFAESTPEFLAVLSQPWMDYTFFMQPKHYLKQFHPRYVPMEKIKELAEKAGIPGEEWYRLFQQKMLMPWEPKIPGLEECPVLHPWVQVESTPEIVTLERNPYYFKIDARGNQLPYVDRVKSSKVGNPETANMKIISGEVDLAEEMAHITSLPLYKEYEEKAGIRVILAEVPYNPVVYAFNFTYPDPVWRKVASDIRFRKALNMAINRDEIIDVIYHGFAELPQWIPSEYDPEKAKKLLDEVGLDKRNAEGWRLGPDGKEFVIYLEVCAHLPDTVPVTELVTEYWKAVGIKTIMKVVDIGLLTQHAQANELQFTTIWRHSTVTVNIRHAKMDLLDPIPLWQAWYRTNGKEGEEPSEDFKKLWEVAQHLNASLWETGETPPIYKRYRDLFYKFIPQINVTHNPKTVVIASRRLGNLPIPKLEPKPWWEAAKRTSAGQWIIYGSEQLFYKE